MDSQNPYQTPKATPKETPKALESFDPARLPIVFHIRRRWLFFWGGFCLMWLIQLGMSLYSIWLAIANGQAFFGKYLMLIAFLLNLCMGVVALCSRIEISRAGIRTHLFYRAVPWSDIHGWSKDKPQKITITLANGKKRMIVGPAISAVRINIVEDALAHFVGEASNRSDIG